MKPMTKNKSAGFTLIELMIALIILTILCTVAYPSYQDTVLKARRAEGRAALHSVMMHQERYYTQHNTYMPFDSNTKDSPFKWWSGDTVGQSFYEISGAACSGQALTQCIQLTATPGGANVRDWSDAECGSLMLDSVGNKSYSISTEPNSLCW